MKLMPKSVVNTELASQKKKQIDEGLMIARKVDVLRETLASLEKQHRDFISGMQNELKSQTQPLIDKVARLRIEIQDLSEKREKLLVPLTKEWNEVNKKRKELDRIEERLSQEQALLRKDTELLEARLKREKDNIFKINTVKNEIARLLKKQQDEELETSKELESAKLIKQKAIEDFEEQVKIFKSRETEIAIVERDNKLLKDSLEREKQFISEEKLRLADQRKTLERTISRLKK